MGSWERWAMGLVEQPELVGAGAALQRYEARAAERERTRRTLVARGILHADSPERVAKRLARLGADRALADALARTPARATTGRNLEADLAPDDFGADILGLERLMGRNDLIDVGFLERGRLAARSVGRITVRAGGGRPLQFGTGWLVSPRVVLTNHHVLRDPEAAARAHIEFNVQSGPDGLPLTPICFTLDPHAFFLADPDLDFAFAAIAPRSTTGEDTADFGWLRLVEQEGKVILGERVNIIQHPNGEPKQLALRENTVVDLLDAFLHYETDTAPGASGAPVFNDQFEVVALHHRAVPRTDEQGRPLSVDGSPWTKDQGEARLAWKANEGARISRVSQALREQRLSGAAEELRAEILDSAAAPPVVAPARRPIGLEASGGPVPGVARVTVPVQITISVTADGAPAGIQSVQLGPGAEPDTG